MRVLLALRLSVGVFLLLALASGTAFAQNATIVGVASDESQAVLPGATITAKEISTGRTFTAVSEANGEYRLAALPPGRYEVQAELSGFATAITRDFELLVGQNARLNFNLKVSTLAETITVEAQAPLVDTQAARVTGNVDRRQMETLPINGRNWMELTMMVKGVTANSISDQATAKDFYYQVNVDGQQITQNNCCARILGNIRMSREAIAEYQVVTSLFDVTMGRSLGLQVNAVTKSGTNKPSGSFFTYVRNDKLNAEDFIAKRVLPYSNQQMGVTLGGPVIENKLFYFGSYEYEREPREVVIAPGVLAPQQLTYPTKNGIHLGFGRLDYQLGQKDRIMGRVMAYRKFNAASTESLGGFQTVTSPNQLIRWLQHAKSVQGEWTRVISNTTIQQLTVGRNYYNYDFNFPDGFPRTYRYVFPGFTWGPIDWMRNTEHLGQPLSAKYQLTSQRSGHELKMGGELVYNHDYGNYTPNTRGTFTFSSLPPDLGRRFPLDAWKDPSRWDLVGLDPYILYFDISPLRDPGSPVQEERDERGFYQMDLPRPQYAVWFGDNWRVNNRLTLNLGARYELAPKDFIVPGRTLGDLIINNGKFTENVGYVDGNRDLNNIAPRVGFAWTANQAGSLVIRGGSGLFHGTNGSNYLNYQQGAQEQLQLRFLNDGRPGFVSDPLRGATVEDFITGRRPSPPQNETTMEAHNGQPYSWQSMVGFQKQITNLAGFDADIVYQRGYNEVGTRDANLFYDPATGHTRNPALGRPNTAYQRVRVYTDDVKSDYLALVSSLTRRYNGKFQVGGTYTLMFFKNENGSALDPLFDREGGWGRSGDFQRHTVRVNGLYQFPGDVSLSGLIRYGSGNYFQISPGVNLLDNGGTALLRRDGTLVPINSFLGDKYLTTDLRISKTFRFGGVQLEGMAEVFNVFNYAHYERTLIETSPAFRTPFLSDPPRRGQLALKVSF